MFAAEATDSSEASDKPVDIFSLSLEDLKQASVIGASKREEPTTKAPSSVLILTSDEVKKYGYRTLAAVLQRARGLYTTYDRNYSFFLGIRGFNAGDANSRVLVLVDGHRINNDLTDGAAIGTDFILDVDLIDRVEVIRGPSAVLYGNNAFFGVINVITRTGASMEGYGAELTGETAAMIPTKVA